MKKLATILLILVGVATTTPALAKQSYTYKGFAVKKTYVYKGQEAEIVCKGSKCKWVLNTYKVRTVKDCSKTVGIPHYCLSKWQVDVNK